MPVSLSSIQQLLLPGLVGVMGDYDIAPSPWRKIYNVSKSEQNTEKAVTTRMLSAAQIGTEGSATPYDNNSGTRFNWNFRHLLIKLGYAITKEAIDDNLYKAEFNPISLGLKNAFETTRNTLAAQVFNFATVFNPELGGDGQPLFSAQHPIDGATFPNVPTMTIMTPSGPVTSAIFVGLSYTALALAQTAIKTQFRLQSGLRANFRGKTLYIPAELELQAQTIYRSKLVPGTANNDTNVLFDMTDSSLNQELVIDQYLSNPQQWQIITNCPDAFVHFERIPLTISSFVDPETKALKVDGYTRYLFSYKEPMGVFGSSPFTSSSFSNLPWPQ
jgi:hypothetical protein